MAVANVGAKIGDVVWCQLKGWPKWPARIKSVYGIHGQMMEIVWFNDYRVSKVHKGQTSKFGVEPYDEDNLGLKTAIKEAVLYIKSLKQA